MNEQISVVILTSRGPRHSYFCRELAKHFSIRGIVVDDRYHAGSRLWTFMKSNGFNPFRMFRSLGLKRQMLPYERRDRQTESQYFPPGKGESEFPAGVPLLFSPDPNSEAARRWVEALSPEFLAVFGTRLIKAPLLILPTSAALNLHTGLSPYYRGGQCTFWALAEGDWEHVGVTVHHLSDKIDGGDIVYTARPEIEPEDTVRSLECKLVRLGTERMIQAIREIKENRAPRTPQREKGKLFLSKMFTLEKRLEFEKRLQAGWLAEQLKPRERKGGPA